MSQLKLKQILEFISTSPNSGDALLFNTSTGKYENNAIPNTFGLPYRYNSSGTLASGDLKFDNPSNPANVTVSDTDIKGSSAVTVLTAATLSSNLRKSIVVISKKHDGTARTKRPGHDLHACRFGIIF